MSSPTQTRTQRLREIILFCNLTVCLSCSLHLILSLFQSYVYLLLVLTVDRLAAWRVNYFNL